MDGVDLARTVRLKWPWIRTVLTSGAPLEEDLDKALEQVRFMPKPWRALEVLMEAEKAAKSSGSSRQPGHETQGSLSMLVPNHRLDPAARADKP
jgi:hypothetical protein